MNDWISSRSKKAIGGGAVLATGLWVVAQALRQTYDILFVNHSTSTVSVVVTAALLLNSIATCWFGLRGFINTKWATLAARSNGVPGSKTALLARISGFLLIGTGIFVAGFLLFAIYVVYLFRSVFPWNDPEEPMQLYKDLGIIVTSVCACWVGVKLVRQGRSLPLEKGI